MCWHLGQAQQARSLLERSLKLLGAERRRPMLAEALLYLSLLEHSKGNYAKARQLVEAGAMSENDREVFMRRPMAAARCYDALEPMADL